jgi:hypothetical protein
MVLRLPLQLHPDSGGDALSGIEVEVARTGPRRLLAEFRLLGGTRHVKWPKPGEPVRADELWRQTCLEVFLRPGDEEGYLEFNLTPAGQWAAYRFSGYRQGMEIATEIDEPGIVGGEESRQPLSSSLKFELRLDRAVWLPLHLPWRLGLSAIIEDKQGRVSYWALAHPPGKPDFHHPSCFTLQLPAARPA